MAHVSDNTIGKKTIATLVLVTFLVTSIVWNPAQGYGETGTFDLAKVFQPQDAFHEELLSLPPEIGTITEASLPQTTDHRLKTADNNFQSVTRGPWPVDPFVVLIQDAHANPEAQANVKAILEFLAGRYPKMSVAVEGAAGPLHPEYFDLTPGYPEANRAVVDDLKQKGELSGAELFAWQHYEQGLATRSSGLVKTRNQNESQVQRNEPRVVGVENPDLYRENLRTYREILFKQDEIETLLNPLRAELEKRGSRVFSPELRDFLKERARRKEGKYSTGQPAQDPNFEAYLVYLEKAVLKTLSIDLSDPFEQLRFPNLVRLNRLRTASKDLDPAETTREWQKFLEDLGKKLPGEKGLLTALRHFAASNGFLREERPAGGFFLSLPPELLPRKLLEYLFYLESRHPSGLSNYKQVLQSFRPVILKSELDAAKLFEEVDALEELLITKLAVKDDEKKLVHELKVLSLFEKALRLELTRREYESIRPDQKVFDGFIRDSGPLGPFFARALDFYRLAGKRDDALVKNALRQPPAARHTPQVIALVTGGFHTDGIAEILKQQGVRHAVITPRISRTDRGELYRKTMTGENADLSAYFKVANPFSTKQEAILFKQVLEIAAPALFEKYQMKPQEIAENVKQAFASSPVLSRAVSSEPLANGAALRFTPKSFGPALPQTAAIPAELMMNGDSRIFGGLAPRRGEVPVPAMVTFDTAKVLRLDIRQDDKPQVAAEALSLQPENARSETRKGESRITAEERRALEEQGQVILDWLAVREEYVPGKVPDASWKPVSLDALKADPSQKNLAMVLGTWDERTAHEAAGVIKELRSGGVNMKVLTSGKYGNKPGVFFDEKGNRLPEAVAYERIMKKYDVSVDFTEPDSVNTGENIRFSRKLLDEKGFRPDTLLLMQNPILQGRAGLSVVRQYSGTKDDFDRSGIRLVSFAPYLPDARAMEDTELVLALDYALAELKNLREYPTKGYTIPVSVPAGVEAAETLITGILEELKKRSVLKSGSLVRRTFEEKEIDPEIFDSSEVRIGLEIAEGAFKTNGESVFDFDRIANRKYVEGRDIGFGWAGMESYTMDVGNESPSQGEFYSLPNGNLGQNNFYLAVKNGKVYHYSKDSLTPRPMLVVKKGGKPEVILMSFKKLGDGRVRTIDPEGKDTTDEIEIALYGLPVIREGRLNLKETLEQLDDLRHMFRFPRFDIVEANTARKESVDQVHLGMSDGIGIFYKDPDLRARLFSGRPVALSVEPLLQRGVTFDEIETVFKAWGYEGRFELDRGQRMVTAAYDPGIHPHSYFGVTKSGKVFIGALKGELETHFKGISFEGLYEQLKARREFAEDPVQYLWIWANGKDVSFRPGGPAATGVRPRNIESLIFSRKPRSEARTSATSRETAVRIETAPYKWLEVWGEAGKLHMKIPAVEASPIDLIDHPRPDKTIAARLTVYADIPAAALEDVMKERPVDAIPGLKKAGRIVFIPKTLQSAGAKDYENWQQVVIDHDVVKTARDLGRALETFFMSRGVLRSETRDDVATQNPKTGVELRRDGLDYVLYKDGQKIGDRVRFHNGLFAAAQALATLLRQVPISADVDPGNLDHVIFKTDSLLSNYSIPVADFEALQELIGLVAASPSLTAGVRTASNAGLSLNFIRDGVPVISIPPSFRRSEMRQGPLVRSPAEVRIEGKALPGMKTEIGRAVFMPKKVVGFQWSISRGELVHARKEYEQWASRIGDFLNRFSKHKDIPQAVLALEGRFRSWLDLEQRIKEARTLLQQLKLAGLAEPASGEERQRVLKELAGLVDFFPYLDLSSDEIGEAEFHLITAEVPEANKRDAEILHALDLVGRAGDLPSMLKQKGAFIREHFSRTKTPLEEMEQLLRTDDAVQGRALASKVLEAVSRDVILRRSPEMIKFLEGALDARIHTDAASLFSEIKLIQKALEEVRNPREQINHPIMALVNRAATDIFPEGESADLVRWAVRIFRDYFQDRARLLQAESARVDKYPDPKDRADAQYRTFQTAADEMSKNLKAQAASLQNRTLVIKRKQAQLEANEKRLTEELKKGQKQDPNRVRQFQAAINECKDYKEKHKTVPEALSRVETALRMLFEYNLDGKLTDPGLRQMVEEGNDLYFLLFDKNAETIILNLMKRPPHPGGNDRLVEGPFDMIYNLREVVLRALSMETGESPVAAPLKAETEHNRILLIRDFVVDADVEAVRQQEGGPMTGVAASTGGPGSHWIQLLMGRTPQPSVIFLNEAADGAQLDRIREGDLIVFMQKDNKVLMILNPKAETLAEARFLQKEDQLKLDAMDKLKVFKTAVPVKETLEADNPGPFEDSDAEGAGLIRTDVQNPELRHDFEGVMRGIIDGRFDFEEWFRSWQSVDFRSMDSEEAIDRFQEKLSRSMDESVLESDEGLASEMANAYGRLVESPFFDGREVPLRTLDLTDDSKGAVLVALLRKIHNENPERGLIKNPEASYLGFEFYRNSKAGKYYLTKQLAQMLLVYYRARAQGRTGTLAPLFPMLSNPDQADFIRDEILPAAVNLAVWKLASPKQLLDPEAKQPALGTHLKPEGLRALRVQMQELVDQIPFGAMVEEMEMLKSPARREALIRHPFLKRFNFGTSDLTSQASGVGREEEGSEDLLNRTDSEQLEVMSLFGMEIAEHNRRTGEDKRLCVCGLKAPDLNFLFPVARWKADLGIPVSTSVPLTQISATKHALLRYENVPGELVNSVLMNWLDTASDHQAADDLDMRIRDFQTLWLTHSGEFLKEIWRWHTRFMQAGAYASFYRSDIDPVHGLGSAAEFAYLKSLVTQFLNNQLEPAGLERLKSLNLSPDSDMTELEANALAADLEEQRFFTQRDIAQFEKAFVFLNAIRSHYLKTVGQDAGLRKGIQPRNLSGFLSSFIKEHPDLGLTPLPENPSPEDLQKQEDEFYRQYYLQANYIFNVMISYIHEVLAKLFPPDFSDEKKVDTLKSKDGTISVDLMTHRRTGWMFERPEGIVAKTVTELFVLPDRMEDLRLLLKEQPELLVSLFHRTVRTDHDQIHLGHPLRKLMQQVIRELPSFEDLPPIVRQRTNRGFQAFLKDPGHLGYAFWREHRIGWLSHYLPGYEGIRSDFFKGENRLALHMQTLRGMDFFEDLAAADRLPLRHAADVAREIKHAADGERVMILRMAVLVDGILKSRFKNQPLTYDGTLTETGRILKGRGWSSENIEQVAWLVSYQRQLAAYDLIDERRIGMALAEIFEKKTTPQRMQLNNAPWLFDLLYLLILAEHFGRLSPDRTEMVLRQGPESELANWEKFHRVGDKMLLAELENRPEPDVGSLLESMEQLVSGEPGEKEFQQRLPFLKNPEARKALILQYERAAGKIAEKYRELVERELEQNLNDLIQEYKEVFGIYYAASLAPEAIGRQLVLLAYLRSLRSEEDYEVVPVLFEELPSKEGKLPVEVLIGAPRDEPGLIYLYSRVLYANRFTTAAVPEIGHDEISVVSFVGTFPVGADFDEIREKVRQELAAVFKKKTLLQTPVKDLLLSPATRRLKARYHVIDGLYGPLHIWKRHGLRGNETQAEVSRLSDRPEIVEVGIKTASCPGILSFVTSVVGRIFKSNMPQFRFVDLSGGMASISFRAEKIDGKPWTDRELKAFSEFFKTWLDKQAVQLDKGVISEDLESPEEEKEMLPKSGDATDKREAMPAEAVREAGLPAAEVFSEAALPRVPEDLPAEREYEVTGELGIHPFIASLLAKLASNFSDVLQSATLEKESGSFALNNIMAILASETARGGRVRIVIVPKEGRPDSEQELETFWRELENIQEPEGTTEEGKILLKRVARSELRDSEEQEEKLKEVTVRMRPEQLARDDRAGDEEFLGFLERYRDDPRIPGLNPFRALAQFKEQLEPMPLPALMEEYFGLAYDYAETEGPASGFYLNRDPVSLKQDAANWAGELKRNPLIAVKTFAQLFAERPDVREDEEYKGTVAAEGEKVLLLMELNRRIESPETARSIKALFRELSVSRPADESAGKSSELDIPARAEVRETSLDAKALRDTVLEAQQALIHPYGKSQRNPGVNALSVRIRDLKTSRSQWISNRQAFDDYRALLSVLARMNDEAGKMAHVNGNDILSAMKLTGNLVSKYNLRGQFLRALERIQRDLGRWQAAEQRQRAALDALGENKYARLKENPSWLEVRDYLKETGPLWRIDLAEVASVYREDKPGFYGVVRDALSPQIGEWLEAPVAGEKLNRAKKALETLERWHQFLTEKTDDGLGKPLRKELFRLWEQLDLMIKAVEQLPPQGELGLVDTARSEMRAGSAGFRHVLFSDDDPSIRRLVPLMLERFGIARVSVAANGADALEMFRRDPSIDLVMTDMLMPRMTGRELFEAVKKVRRIPVMLVSGDLGSNDSDRAAIKAAQEAGELIVLEKPVEMDVLRKALDVLYARASFSPEGRSELRGMQLSGSTPEVKETLLKVGARGGFDIADRWVPMELREPVVSVAETVGNYSEEGIAVYTGDHEKARLWIASRLTEMLVAKAQEQRISNPELERAIRGIVTAVPVSVRLPSSSIDQGPVVPVDLSFLNMQDWQELFRSFPVILANLVSLNARLLISVDGSRVDVQEIETQFREAATKGGLNLGEKQLQIFDSGVGKFFGSLAKVNEADALLAGSEEAFEDIAYHGKIGTRWIVDDDAKTNMPRLAAEISTVLYAALDQKLRANRFQFYRPSQYSSGALLQAVLTAVQAYLQIRAAA